MHNKKFKKPIKKSKHRPGKERHDSRKERHGSGKPRHELGKPRHGSTKPEKRPRSEFAPGWSPRSARASQSRANCFQKMAGFVPAFLLAEHAQAAISPPPTHQSDRELNECRSVPRLIVIRSASRITSSGAQGFDQNLAPSGNGWRSGLPEVTITSRSGTRCLATCASSTPVIWPAR